MRFHMKIGINYLVSYIETNTTPVVAAKNRMNSPRSNLKCFLMLILAFSIECHDKL